MYQTELEEAQVNRKIIEIQGIRDRAYIIIGSVYLNLLFLNFG